MKLWYDFHIHTCLSPCASNEMTPNNIVNMALLKKLDIICVLDHNHYYNSISTLDAAKNKDIIVFPGIEIETREEVHVVVMFNERDMIKSFGEIIYSKLVKRKNRKDIFGEQIIMDKKDEKIGEEEYMLAGPIDISYKEVFELSKKYNGIFFPAHIDRGSNSVISNLGMIPEDVKINNIEISKMNKQNSYVKKNKYLNLEKYNIFSSSDAHYLGDINERINYIDIKNKNKTIFENIMEGSVNIYNGT